MQIISNILSVVQKATLFAAVLTILAFVARTPADRSAETETFGKAVPVQKMAKSVRAESGWTVSDQWRDFGFAP